MAKSFDGRWQFFLLNGAPDPEFNEYVLADGVLMVPGGEYAGTYEVAEDALVLNIAMTAMGVDPWALRVRLPLLGVLAGEQMLGTVEAVLADGESFPISECAFNRV